MRRHILRFALGCLALAGGSTPAFADIRLDVPKEVSFFEAPAIRVQGLAALQPVEIKTTTVDARDTAFESKSEFIADLNGEVDTRRSIANGDYEGIDPMGVFWSARGSGVFQLLPGGPVRTHVEVKGKNQLILASADIDRRVVPRTVTVTQLRRPASPFVATLYTQPGDAKRPAVVTLGGSEGGIDARMAPMLATHGYDALSLGYYHGEGLPNDVIEIPLEYFRDAVRWMKARPQSNGKIALIGLSKGAEAALLIAVHYPALVDAVAAFTPTSVVWEGVDARARFGGDPRSTLPENRLGRSAGGL